MIEIPVWHQLVLIYLVFILGWGLSFLLHARHRRWARQLGVVKAEAIRLKADAPIPADLWHAIAPYERD